MMRRGGGIHLGRILGVEITLDPSWFIFGLLIAWLLGDTFRASPLYLSPAAGWLLGAMGAVLFLFAVLAHELAHSVVARRKGIEVHGITLFIFGGVAQITEEPRTPGDEIKISIAGPVMSVAVGFFLLLLGAAAAATGAKAAQELFDIIGGINLLLALFNLLPGFPLDGGRIFRAIVWRSTGSHSRATKIAANSGRVIGLGLLALGGVLILLTGDLWDGIWLGLIGLFLHQTALGYSRQASLPLANTTVADLMTRQPEWVASSAPLDATLYQRLVNARDRALPVVAPEGWIAGVVTAEILDSIPREHWPALTTGQVMIPMQSSMAADAAEPYTAVLVRLPMNPSGRFVVLDQGRLVGMLTPAAIGPLPERLPAPQRG